MRLFDFNIRRRTLTYLTFGAYIGITYQTVGISPTVLLMFNYNKLLDCSYLSVCVAEYIPSVTNKTLDFFSRIYNYTGLYKTNEKSDDIEMNNFETVENDDGDNSILTDIEEWTVFNKSI